MASEATNERGELMEKFVNSGPFGGFGAEIEVKEMADRGTRIVISYDPETTERVNRFTLSSYHEYEGPVDGDGVPLHGRLFLALLLESVLRTVSELAEGRVWELDKEVNVGKPRLGLVASWERAQMLAGMDLSGVDVSVAEMNARKGFTVEPTDRSPAEVLAAEREYFWRQHGVEISFNVVKYETPETPEEVN